MISYFVGVVTVVQDCIPANYGKPFVSKWGLISGIPIILH